MAVIYCISCGARHTYTSDKPTTCSKCKHLLSLTSTHIKAEEVIKPKPEPVDLTTLLSKYKTSTTEASSTSSQSIIPKVKRTSSLLEADEDYSDETEEIIDVDLNKFTGLNYTIESESDSHRSLTLGEAISSPRKKTIKANRKPLSKAAAQKKLREFQRSAGYKPSKGRHKDS